MEDNFSPDPHFIIQDLETLKVVADPLRTQIVELLVHEALTVRQVAERLGLASSKLYYHFGLLETHGLIRIVSTRMVANVLEKQYRAAALDYDFDKSLLTFSTPQGQENLMTLVRTTIDATRDDLLRSFQARAFALEQGSAAQPRQIILTRSLSRLSEARAEELRAKLQALLREFSADEPGPEAQPFALTLAFYPTFYYPAEAGAAD